MPLRAIPGALGRTRYGKSGIVDLLVGRDSWRPELMTLHELGHWMDVVLGGGRPASSQKRADMSPALQALFAAIRASAAYAASRRLPSLERGEWRRRREMWARAWAQYIAWRSGSIRLRRQMDRALTSPLLRRQLLQWDYEDWLPIAMAMDRVLSEAGWLTRR